MASAFAADREIACQHQLLGLRKTDTSRQPDRRAGPWKHCVVGVRISETCRLRGQYDVAGEHQLQPTRDCNAVDGGDHRPGASLDGRRERAQGADERDVAPRDLAPLLALLEIGAGTERATCASEHHNPHLWVGSSYGNGPRHPIDEGRRQRVQRSRPVQSKPEDAVGELDVQLVAVRKGSARYQHQSVILTL